jgi:hypothetical protein
VPWRETQLLSLLSLQSSKKKKTASTTECIASALIFSVVTLYSIHLSSPNANADKPLLERSNKKDRIMVPDTEHLRYDDVVKPECRDQMMNKIPAPKPKQYPQKGEDGEAGFVSNGQGDGLAEIVDPYKSTCYDWKGNIIPCVFKRQYVELLFDKPIPDPRFVDNQNGTLTDNLTGLTWLKNTQCFGAMDWESANLAVRSLKDGDCGADPAHILSDGSSAGDWRLPTMNELCTLIDFSRRDPALPDGHMFSAVPPGYHWSATTLDHHSGMAWIVYFESGTTCYEDVTNQAGYVLPVR